VAERRRRRKARLAGMDLLTILGGKPAQIEHLALHGSFAGDDLTSAFQQPVGLGHLAGTGVLAAGRRVDEENPRRQGSVRMSGGRVPDRIACFEPIERKLIGRIGELAAGGLRFRRLSVLPVAVPCRLHDAIELWSYRIEGRIGKALEIAGTKLFLGEVGGGHSLADTDIRHWASPFAWGIENHASRRCLARRGTELRVAATTVSAHQAEKRVRQAYAGGGPGGRGGGGSGGLGSGSGGSGMGGPGNGGPGLGSGTLRGAF
jgi:hypothetical protein